MISITPPAKNASFPRRRPLLRALSLVLCLLLSVSLFGCQKEEENSDGRNLKVEAVLTTFFDSLQKHDYDTAYSLLSSEAQKLINPVSFASLYSNFFNLMKVTSLSVSVSQSNTELLHNVSHIALRYENNLGDDIENEQRIELVKQEDEWRIEWHPALLHSALEWDDRFASRSTTAKRGEIFAQGQLVAANEPGVSILLIPSEITNPYDTVAQLSPLVNIEEDKINDKLENSHPQAQVTVERVVLRDAPSKDNEISNELISLSQGEIVELLETEVIPPIPSAKAESDEDQETLETPAITPSPAPLGSPTSPSLIAEEPGFYRVRYVQKIVPVNEAVAPNVALADVLAASPTPEPQTPPTLPPIEEPIIYEDGSTSSSLDDVVPTESATPETTQQPTDAAENLTATPTPVYAPEPTTVVAEDGTKTVTLDGYIYAPYVRTRYSQDVILVKTFRREQISNDVLAQIESIPGVRIDDSGQYVSYRYYPFGASMFHVVGYMGTISKEKLDEHLKECKEIGTQPRYNSMSQVGVSGLEKKYEDILRGRDGYEVYIANEDGVVKSMLYRRETQDGLDIHLTIDPNLQKRSYDLLRIYLSEDQSGAIVTTDPLTGAVLSMVSYPAVDPNQLYAMSSSEFDAAVLKNSLKPLFDRVTRGRYTPGSIFKPFTAALGLETGAIQTNSQFPYEASIEKNKWDPRLNGFRWNWPSITRVDSVVGDCNFYNAMAMSDNIFFAWTAMRIGQEDFWNYCTNKLGFYEDIPFDLDVQTSKVFTVSDSYPAFNTKFLADSGYGQGQLTVSPLHAAAIFGCFANEGDAMRPYIVDSLKHSEGLEYVSDISVTPSVWKHDVVTDPDALRAVNEGMRLVITQGSGTRVSAPYPVAGKTGTAEIDKKNKRELAWMVAFKSSEPKDFLACVVIECFEKQGRARYSILSALFDYDGNTDDGWQETIDGIASDGSDQSSTESIDPRTAASVLDSQSAADSSPDIPEASSDSSDDSHAPDLAEDGFNTDEETFEDIDLPEE